MNSSLVSPLNRSLPQHLLCRTSHVPVAAVPVRGFKVIVPPSPGGPDNLKKHQLAARQAWRRLQNMQKQDRLASNLKRHSFFTKPKMNKVRLANLKSRNKSFSKISAIRELVDWKRGDIRGMKPDPRYDRSTMSRVLTDEERAHDAMKWAKLRAEIAGDSGDSDEEGELDGDGELEVDEFDDIIPEEWDEEGMDDLEVDVEEGKGKK